jgi:hypothetical protein
VHGSTSGLLTINYGGGGLSARCHLGLLFGRAVGSLLAILRDCLMLK